MTFKHLLACAALSLSSFTIASPAAAQDNLSFDAYLQLVIAKARAQGVSENTIARMTAGLEPNYRVIELDREANELLDVFVNGTLIGRGEVVTVGERFGVRMTELVSPEKRVARA